MNTMMKLKKAIYFPYVLLLLAFSFALRAQDIPDAPDPPRLVNDLAGVLSGSQANYLEQKLVRFNDSTSTQIVVLTVTSLNGYDPADFADRIGEKWGVGQKGKNNGIVVLVKPKYGNERGEAHISVAYGLEGIIPDAIAARIVRNEMIPHFSQNDYFSGIDQATGTLMALARGEFTADAYNKTTEDGKWGFLVPIIIFIIIFIIFNNRRGRHYHAGSTDSSIWTAIWLASMMGGGRGGSSWGDFRSGGGSFGGGGGFGGFGGGSFGGGGAGGSW